MGSNQSARKLTLVNEEDDSNIIRLSEAVVKRITNSVESSRDAVVEESRTPVHTEEVAPVPTMTLQSKELSDAYYPVYTISALEMKKKKEQELAEQEAYWVQRLKKLQKQHEKINEIMDLQYKKALSIFDDSRVVKAQGAVKPCNDNAKKLLKCYEDNPRETLRCAHLVQDFTNCVDQCRAQLMKCN